MRGGLGCERKFPVAKTWPSALLDGLGGGMNETRGRGVGIDLTRSAEFDVLRAIPLPSRDLWELARHAAAVIFVTFQSITIVLTYM